MSMTVPMQRKKGMKSILLDLNPGETHQFPRANYTYLRTTLSILRVEHPERKYQFQIVETGIIAECLK